MNDIPVFAPGCFGSALAYQEDNSVCISCPFVERCVPLHRQNLEALRERFGIDAKRGRKIKVVKAEPGSVSSDLALPEKTRKLIEWFDRSSLNVVESLKTGVNPFDGNTRGYLRAMAHILMNINRPITRQEFSAALVRKFDWAETTANSHVRMAIQALVHIGAIEETEAGARLRR